MTAPVTTAPPVPNNLVERTLGLMRTCQGVLDTMNMQCAPDGTAARIAAGRVVESIRRDDWQAAHTAAGEMLGHLTAALAAHWQREAAAK